jgi:hypothetical protein
VDLEKAQEEWWNDLTDEEREREVAEALMEARWIEQVEEMQKEHYEAEYQRNRRNSDFEELCRLTESDPPSAYNYPMVDGEQHPEPNPDWDEIPF